MLFIAMTLGTIAFPLGFHPAIGAYFAGLFLHANYFVNKATRTEKNVGGDLVRVAVKDDQFKKSQYVIDHLSFSIFGPIFFINLGGKLEFDTTIIIAALPAVITLFLAVVVFQLALAFRAC